MNDVRPLTRGKVLVLIGCAIMVLGGCNRQPITWETNIALPLVDQVWTWSEVIQGASDDSTLAVDVGSPGTIVFSGPVAEWGIESLTQLPDTIVSQELTPDFDGGPFAVPPGAVLLDTEEDIVFQGIDQAFTGIVLESGRIEYFVESSTNGYVELFYAFPSVTIFGQPVELQVVLPPSDGVAFETREGAIDLSGAVIDLTGVSGNEINRIASQLIIGTPSNINDTAQVYGSDSIRVQMHFQELLVREVSGYFGQETIGFDVEQQVFDPVDFPSGFVEINPTRATLQFRNTIAADLRLQLDAMSVDGLQVTHPSLGLPQLISRAAWEDGALEPAIWEMDLLETAPSIFELLSYLPQWVQVVGEGLLNPLGDVSGGHDYFDTRVPPALYLDLEWPLVGTIEDFQIARSLELSPTDLPGFNGDLLVRLTNGFPVEWTFNAVWRFPGTGIDPVFIEGLVPAFPGGEMLELRIPVDEQRLATAGVIDVVASMRSEGPVEFTGRERIRMELGVEGMYQVEVP